MTDTSAGPSKGDMIEARIDRTTAGAVVASNEFGGLRIQNMLEVMEMAKLMAVSSQAVPLHLRNNPGMCLAICLTALEWKMSPFAVANKSYVTNDRLNYESQLVHAVIEARAPLKERLKVRYEGEGADRICVVYGTFRGESAPREHRSPRLADCIPPKNEYGKVKGSPLWTKKPDVQMFYDTSRDFCRIYCPDVLLGIYTPDEVEQYGIGEDAKDITAGAALHERLKNSPKSGEGFSDEAVTNGLADGEPVAEKTQTEQAARATEKPAGEPDRSEAPGQGAEASGSPRRPGGRPKGSKNKPKGEVVLEQATSDQPPEPAEGPQRMTEAELINGLKPLTVVADEAEREAQERQAEKPQEPVLPKNSDQYEAHALAYIAAATVADDLDKRWRSEKDLRTNCMIESGAYGRCYDAWKAKLTELRGKA